MTGKTKRVGIFSNANRKVFNETVCFYRVLGAPPPSTRRPRCTRINPTSQSYARALSHRVYVLSRKRYADYTRLTYNIIYTPRFGWRFMHGGGGGARSLGVVLRTRSVVIADASRCPDSFDPPTSSFPAFISRTYNRRR